VLPPLTSLPYSQASAGGPIPVPNESTPVPYRTPRRTLSQKNTAFHERRRPLAGAMQSHQKNDTSPLSRPLEKIDV
jgi:hypothetical protein